MARKNGHMPAYGPHSDGAAMGYDSSRIHCDIRQLGNHKTLDAMGAKVSNFRKYWYFHLTNLMFFFFFSGVGIFAGQALKESIRHAREEATMEIISDLPLRALLEVHI